MKITYNGHPADVPLRTLAGLLRDRNLPVDGIAVAVNGEVVPRARHADHHLADGDTVDVAVQGG